MNWKVPFFDLVLGDEEKRAVLRVIESNWLTAGPRIADLESAFSAATGGEVQCVALSSATAGLHLSLLALGIGAGDEVIVPSLTFVACANVIRYVGATPVFADVTGELDWNLSPADVAARITPRTRAIMVVHYAGYPCDMDQFQTISQDNGLALIEDCSHAPLGTRKGKPLGTFGDTGCFSFFSNKNMTTGEGGMIISRNRSCRAFRSASHGITGRLPALQGPRYGYDVAELAIISLDEIRAASEWNSCASCGP